VARAALFPTVSVGTTASSSKVSGSLATGRNFAPPPQHSLTFPVIDFSYQADLWGSVRRTVRASAESAQVSAAQLENIRLLLQATLAQDYFALHGLDGDEDLLERTVKSYEEYLTLTKNRLAAGVATGGDVAQAEAQLGTAQAQLIDFGVARAQFEHAIAMLTGRPPSDVSISRKILTADPPVVPLSMPSGLLERRPDIAAAERQMAALNEQVGIAQAAFYPNLTITASAGLQGSGLGNLFSWPSRFWSVSPNMLELVYDAGRRRGVLSQTEDAFDVAVANYRQTVLTAFQQVEDSLSALRILEREAQATAETVKAAEQSLEIATFQYKAGTTTYLQVITTQAIALQNERAAVDIRTRRITESVLLIEALGGGWDAATLPSVESLTAQKKSR